MRLLQFVRAAAAGFSLLIALRALPTAAAPVDFASLSAGDPAAPPPRRAAPSALPGSASVRGLYRVDTSRLLGRAKPGFHEFALFDDALRAKAYEAAVAPQFSKSHPDARHSQTGAPNTSSDTCFATPSNFRVPEQHDPRPLAWDTFSAGAFTGQSFPNDAVTRVIPVRAERWVEAGETASIETSLFWLDLRSGGSRLIARSTTSLGRVATPFTGVSVHALRTGADSVSFFVHRQAPRLPEQHGNLFLDLAGAARERFDPTQFRTALEGATRQNGCNFERVDLKLRPDAGADAASAEVEKASGGKPAPPPLFFPPGFSTLPPAFANVTFAVVYALETESLPAQAPGGAGGASSELKTSPLPQATPRGTARGRTMVVNVGIGRAPGETTPVPSVSYRWLDRPRTLAF